MFKIQKLIYNLLYKIVYKWDFFLEDMFGMGSINIPKRSQTKRK
ncbi:hypothetical protein OAT42_02280 [Alphaproteobacteria bacterium]|nr:hypothetical protein [Alphaproteobacteria bacterium]